MTQSSIENGSNINEPAPEEAHVHGEDCMITIVDGETGEQTHVKQSEIEAESSSRLVVGVFVGEYTTDDGVTGSVEVTIKATPNMDLQDIINGYIAMSQPSHLAMLWNANADPDSQMTEGQFEAIKYQQELRMMARRDPNMMNKVNEMLGQLTGEPNHTEPDQDVPDEKARRIADNPQA